jgi:hypothetical protein
MTAVRSSIRRVRAGLVVAGLALAAGVTGVVSQAASAAADRPNSLAGASATAPVANGAYAKDTIGTAADEDWFRFDVPYATKVMATLGNLPANYSLSIHDSTGRLLRTSNRSGVTFENVLWTAPAKGTYYARVDAAGGYNPAEQYALRFRLIPKGLVVFSQYASLQSNGHVSIMADIVNTTSGWRKLQSVTVVLRDKDGKTLGYDLTSLSNIVLPPGGVSKINSATVVPAPAGFAKVLLKPAWVDAPARTEPKLSVHQTGSGKDATGLPTYQGRVSTTSPTPVENAVIEVSDYDTYGNVRLTQGFVLPTIPANGSVNYDVTQNWAPFYAPNPNRVAIMSYVQRFGYDGEP